MKHDLTHYSKDCLKKMVHLENGEIKVMSSENKEICSIKCKKAIISFHITENNYIIVQNLEKKFGIISYSGKVIASFLYKNIESIRDKVIFYKTNKECFISDPINGKQSLLNYEKIRINGFGKYMIASIMENMIF